MGIWYTYTLAAEFADEEQQLAFADVLAEAVMGWGEDHGVDMHLSGIRERPDWLEDAPTCQIPDCEFPAEWAIQVYVNGGTQDYLCCGAHREETAAAAASSAEVAWGDAEVSVREI